MKKFVLCTTILALLSVLVGFSIHAGMYKLTLIYNGHSSNAYIREYHSDNIYAAVAKYSAGKVAFIPKTMISVKRNSTFTFSIDKKVLKCTLAIHDNDTKKRVIQLLVKNRRIPTNLSKGKYLYVFVMKWKDGNAIYEQPIELK